MKKEPMMEVYRLTLHHEFVDDEGKRHRLNEPIVVQQVIEHHERVMLGSPVIVDEMMERFRKYLLNALAKEE